MKFKTTAKQIRSAYRCYCVGYCDLQNLLKFTEPTAYTAGVYGWNADVYTFGDVAIVTGYRPFGARIPCGLIREYEEMARGICKEHEWGDTKKRDEELSNLC